MRSWRCRWCEVYWPREERYTTCPTCREPTETATPEPNISEGDAEARANQHDFGWWLWDNGLL